MLEFIFRAFLVASIGYVFTHVLITYGNVLHFYSKLLEKIKYEFVRKPLGECTLCFTGQLALWSGLCMFDYIYIIPFICTSILFVIVLENKI
jgi:hypothetical protein